MGLLQLHLSPQDKESEKPKEHPTRSPLSTQEPRIPYQLAPHSLSGPLWPLPPKGCVGQGVSGPKEQPWVVVCREVRELRHASRVR